MHKGSAILRCCPVRSGSLYAPAAPHHPREYISEACKCHRTINEPQSPAHDDDTPWPNTAQGTIFCEHVPIPVFAAMKRSPLRARLPRTLSSPDPASPAQHRSEAAHDDRAVVSVAWSVATSADVHAWELSVGPTEQGRALSATAPSWDIGLTVHVGDTPVVLETPFPAAAPWCAADLSVVAPEAVPVVGGGVATENTSRLLKLLHSRVRPRCCANSIVNSVILNFMLLSCVHCV